MINKYNPFKFIGNDYNMHKMVQKSLVRVYYTL